MVLLHVPHMITALPPEGVTISVRELYYTVMHAKKNKYLKQKARGIEDEIQKHREVKLWKTKK